MATALTDLIKSLSADQIKSSAFTLYESLGFPVASWHKGAVIRTITAVFAALLAPFTELQVKVAKSGFLDYAEGEWLSVVGDQVYSVRRTAATFATGFVTVDNTAGGSFSFAIGAFKVFNSTTRKVYRNTVAFTVDPNETGVEVAIEAIEIGSASTSAAGTIDSIETPGNGLEVTNAAAVTGLDAESDAFLRLRCRAKLASLSPDGPAQVYDYVARTPELNGGVACTKTRVLHDSTTGDVTVICAGPSGALSAPEIALIQAGLDKWATPLCVDATAVSAVNRVINVFTQVWIYASEGMTSAAAQTAIAAQLTDYLNGLRIGGDTTGGAQGYLYYDAIEGEARKAVRIITSSTLVPVGDLTIDEDEVIVPGTMTITVSQVST